MEKTVISWSEAQEINKAQEQEQEQHDTEYQENVNHAYRELMDAMGTPLFRSSDFEQICMGWGIDQDDLLNRII